MIDSFSKPGCSTVQFNVPGAKNGGTDKGPNGHRIDSIPIANGVIKAGGACDIVKYFDTKHEVRPAPRRQPPECHPAHHSEE